MHLRNKGRYQEAWESFRHEVTRKPVSRYVVRWPLGRDLRDEITASEAALHALLDDYAAAGRRRSEGGSGESAWKIKPARRIERLRLRHVALVRAFVELYGPTPPPPGMTCFCEAVGLTAIWTHTALVVTRPCEQCLASRPTRVFDEHKRRQCQVCGALFDATRTTARYCSSACRQKNHRRSALNVTRLATQSAAPDGG